MKYNRVPTKKVIDDTTVRFRVLVRLPSGREEWEHYEKYIGEANFIRGYGTQPEFTGDIQAWGKAIVQWFNDGQDGDHLRRTFVRAELRP